MSRMFREVGKGQDNSHPNLDFLTPEEKLNWAWLAGLVDGEGSINIAAQKPKRRGQNRTFRLHLTIGMTHKPTIDRINAVTHCGYTRLVKVKLPRKPMYHWRVTDKEAAAVLRLCLPFLVTKREQAELALKFMECKYLERPRPGAPLSPAYTARCQEFTRSLKTLRGKP